jgi:thioesterase-3
MKGEIEIKVRGYHLDVYSHVNNARYVEFLEEGRWALFENLELTKAALEMGYAFNIVNINISYTNEACLGETLILKTDLKKYGNKSITLSQKILRKSDGKQAVDADVTFVMLDMNSGRAVELDENLKRLLDRKL